MPLSTKHYKHKEPILLKFDLHILTLSVQIKKFIIKSEIKYFNPQNDFSWKKSIQHIN